MIREIALTGGVPATIISTPVLGEEVRFVCSGVANHVTSLSPDPKPGSGDADKAVRLANLMIEHLDCT